MTHNLGVIKVFSMESDDFFQLFLQDALVVYCQRKIVMTFAPSIKDCLDKLSKSLPEIPDIIFLSLSAPEEREGKINLQGGFKVLKILHENESFKKIPVVIFSKYKEKHLQKKALALGAMRYMVKGECMPRDIAEVVANVEKLKTSSTKRTFLWFK
jgi:CheY-like chemotaxis protein